jgi:hypothetical protein
MISRLQWIDGCRKDLQVRSFHRLQILQEDTSEMIEA